MIDALDIWRTLLAFFSTASGGYMIYVYKGLKRSNSEYKEEVGIFCVVSLIAGLTFFLEVLARL